MTPYLKLSVQFVFISYGPTERTPDVKKTNSVSRLHIFFNEEKKARVFPIRRVTPHYTRSPASSHLKEGEMYGSNVEAIPGPQPLFKFAICQCSSFFCHISPRVLMNPNLSFFVPLLVLICPHLPSIVVDRPDLIIHFLVYSHLSSKAHIVLTGSLISSYINSFAFTVSKSSHLKRNNLFKLLSHKYHNIHSVYVLRRLIDQPEQRTFTIHDNLSFFVHQCYFETWKVDVKK